MTMTVTTLGGIERIQLNKAEELLDELSPRHPRWQPEPALWMFRGHADASWTLLPTALRLCLAGKLSDFEAGAAPLSKEPNTNDLLHLEWVLLQRFMITADVAGLGVPEDRQALRNEEQVNAMIAPAVNRAVGQEYSWPPRDLLSIFALAQHYGVPTRLLDWSWRPRVAAFFAAETSAAARPSDMMAVWALRADFVKYVWGSLQPRVRIVTAPQATNPNLSAQAGVFTCDCDATTIEPFDATLSRAVGKLPSESKLRRLLPALIKYELPADEAGRLLRLLAYEGTSAATVYPGYGGVVKALDQRRLWKP